MSAATFHRATTPPIASDPATSAELVTLAQAGNVPAFESLVATHHTLVYAFAYARLRDRDAAEDLLQEAFLRIYLNLRTLKDPQNFRAWLARVTRNLATDWLRRGQRKSALTAMVSLEAIAQETHNPMHKDARDEAHARQQSHLLEAALQRLPVHQREMVLLYYSDDLTHEEIGQALGMHPATVGRQLKRALQSLRAALDPPADPTNPVDPTNLTDAMDPIGAAHPTHPTLPESARAAWRPRPAAVARSIAFVAVAASLPASSKAALAAGAGALNASTASAVSSAPIATLSALVAALQSLAVIAIKGGVGMASGKAIAAAAAVVALGTGGAVYYKTRPPVDESAWKPNSHNLTAVRPIALVRRSAPGTRPGMVGEGTGPKMIGRAMDPEFLFASAYHTVNERVILPPALATQKLDVILTIADSNAQQALQVALKEGIGYIGTFKTQPTDALALRVKNPAALTLKPSAGPGQTEHSPTAPRILMKNQTLPQLAANFEVRFDKPVLDQTNLTGKYDIQMPNLWRKNTEGGYGVSNETARKELEQMAEESGLELIPVRENLQMLIVEKG